MSGKSRRPLPEPYLTVAQAVEHLAVQPSTIRRWIDCGRLPAARLGEQRIGVRPPTWPGWLPRARRGGGTAATWRHLSGPWSRV